MKGFYPGGLKNIPLDDGGIASLDERDGNLLIGYLVSEFVDRLESLSFDTNQRSIFSIFEQSISELHVAVKKHTQSQKSSRTDLDSERLSIQQIDDMREELSMIRSVLTKQEQVWWEFMRNAFPDECLNNKFTPKVQSSTIASPSLTMARRLYKRFMDIIGRPQTQFAKYQTQIARLDADAERVANLITLQLDLKSKHAILKEAHLTTLMGAAIIGIATVATIFTPLAFSACLLAPSTNRFQAN